MRLIDADAMMSGFAEIVNEEHFAFMTTGQVMEMIDTQPTVEQKHGHWKRHNMDIVEHPLHCTQCGWSNYHIDRYVESFKFCPECGAKMDESEVEENG